MNDKIFSVFVYNWRDNAYGPMAEIDLPATEYELEDALQEVRDGEGGETLVAVESFGDFPFLRSHIGEAEDLRALNALAEKLTSLEEVQVDALHGLMLMDERKGVKIDVPRLYDLAASVDSCQVLYTDDDYESIGRFYAENDFIPELENLPDILWDILDFRQLGQRMAAQEGGVFINNDRAYVVRIDDLKEEFKDLDLTPKKPDYTVLLEVSTMDSGQSTLLELPCDRAVIDSVREQLGAKDLSDLSWRCIDCLVPALRDAFSREDNIGYANHAAKQLRAISSKNLLMYKALVDAHRVNDLSNAVMLIDGMGAFHFTPGFTKPEDVARCDLYDLLDDFDADGLRPFVDLHGYGEKRMKDMSLTLTPYGAVRRNDWEPIQTLKHEPEAGGMTMTM